MLKPQKVVFLGTWDFSGKALGIIFSFVNPSDLKSA
jgi:hypothetical protein